MGAVRHVLRTKLGVGAVVATLALIGTPTLLGVGRGKANDVHSATSSGSNPGGRIAAAASPAHTAVGARLIPFTSFDLFLFASGGAAMLVCGANIGRRKQPAAPAPEPRKAEV
jgi:hypothetical protein